MFTKNHMMNQTLLFVWTNPQSSLLHQQYLRNKSLSYKEITDAKLWGEVGKRGVGGIEKRELESHERFKKGNKFRIHRAAVERIARNRGVWIE